MAAYRLLGPLEVLAADGKPLVLGGQKQRGVLALLLLRANHIVSTESLIAALWGESPPRTAATSLQNVISALRKLLGPAALLIVSLGSSRPVGRSRVPQSTPWPPSRPGPQTRWTCDRQRSWSVVRSCRWAPRSPSSALRYYRS